MSDMVSIIVPVFNASKCISDTILSVKSQTYENWELLLVDDYSTDDSVDKMKEYECDKIHILTSEGQKSAAMARNTGTKTAKGDYLCFLDADDLWAPDKLQKQLDFMKENSAAFSFTGYEFADADGVSVNKIVHVPKTITYRQAVKNTTIFTSTVMFDLAKVDRNLLMMPCVPSEDSATWWQVLKAGHLGYGLDEALTLYRRMGQSLSSNKLVALQRIWNLYRNVEHFSVPYSMYCFCHFAVHAVLRRL